VVLSIWWLSIWCSPCLRLQLEGLAALAVGDGGHRPRGELILCSLFLPFEPASKSKVLSMEFGHSSD
jgi:hypothetical protein